MSELKICRICLRTEAKGYKFDRFQLKYFYEEVIALKVNSSDGLPQWFCYECSTILHKFHKFKEKCYSGQKCLKELLWKGPITYEAIYKIDRNAKHLQSTLATITVTSRVREFTSRHIEAEPDIKIEDDLQYKDMLTQDIEINDDALKAGCTIKQTSNDIKNYDSNKDDPYYSPTSIVVGGNDIVKLESKDVNTSNSKNLEISLKDCSNKYLNDNNWKKVNLTEEEALMEFRSKAEDPKYLDAAFKCKDCFKGFSKKDMLNRHVESRHSEELGPFECRFCRMRFKWKCYLRKHIQQHYTKYECLRCNIVFNLDTSALLHEEYHSGITKKCAHCNEEFRHLTTYYTHLRTHPSAHVCVRCGAAFVSAHGLRQHRGRKHPRRGMDSQDSEDDVLTDTFCERCDIRFDSRKAFEEHLFHSVMHIEVFKKEEQDENIPNRKILGKRLQAKITKELRNEKSDFDTFAPEKSKRRKKIRRKSKKPTTCYQCGAHFDTQSACMKHHVTSHPGTSFFAPAERHICEECGASLAPGSVVAHRNMHSRASLHSCPACARLFHSRVALKRHLVTHTGEKPFGCPLCEKRFTQSNSMKLHYRTFHLKQPYPKRKRKERKNAPKQPTDQESYEEDTNSLPEAGFEPLPRPVPVEPEPEVENEPEVPAVAHNVVINDVHIDMAAMGDGEIHYLTLS